VYRHPGSETGLGKAARISERLQRTGALVEQGAGIGRRAQLCFRLLGIEDTHRRAAPLPLRLAFLDLLQPCWADGAVKRTASLQFAVDAVPIDDIHHQCRAVCFVERSVPGRLAYRVIITAANLVLPYPAYFGAAAAVSPGGMIRNMKLDTFSPGLNGPGTWLSTGFTL
jgi:hypothetical protein